MRERSNRTRLLLLGCVATLVVTALSARLTKKVVYTGDEPRYVLQAISFITEGVPIMSESHYEELRAAHTDETSPLRYSFRELQRPSSEWRLREPRHPILISLFLSPISATWSLEIIRLLPFAVGLTGLCFLAVTLVKQTSNSVSALACFVPAAFAFPALPFQFLALPEIFLFTLTAVIFWDLSSGPREKISGYIPAMACACLAPIVHLRGLALFGAVALYLIYLTKRTSGWRRSFTVSSIFVGASIVLLIANLCLYGHWLGTIRNHPVWKTRMVLDMFVHYRHGLLAYAPIWVLSFAGLVAGLNTRKPWALPSLLLLPVLVIGCAQPFGESYPARYWVQTVPVLALCLSGFTEGVMRTAVKAILYLPLAALSFANSVIFIFHPTLHLEARSAAIPYDFLFKIFPGFHFGFWLDVPDSSFVRMGAICFCALVAAVVAIASINRSKVFELAACFLLLAGFEAHRVRPVAITTAAETNAVVVRVRPTEGIARRPLRLRFQAPWKEIGPNTPIGRGMPPDETIRPNIEVVDGNARWKMPIMSGCVLIHKNASPADHFSITLRWTDRDPLQIDPTASGEDLSALACDSLLAAVW